MDDGWRWIAPRVKKANELSRTMATGWILRIIAWLQRRSRRCGNGGDPYKDRDRFTIWHQQRSSICGDVMIQLMESILLTENKGIMLISDSRKC